MLRVQVKYVDFDKWVVNLPATITKAATDQRVYVGSDRLRRVLKERRELGPEKFKSSRPDHFSKKSRGS